jgi:cell wall assembly regulator SMI1
MTLIASNCDKVLTELYKFSEIMLSLGDPIQDNRILELERQIGFVLPLDYQYIMSKHNYISLGGTEVLGIGKGLDGHSINSLYLFEHEEVGNPMFREFLPFSPDGYGNHYCLDLSKLVDDVCPVIFWEHDCSYEDKNDVEVSNKSFTEWIKEVMVDWNLEDSNYDGSDKNL